METTTKRGFLLARGWIQAVILVFLFGFFVLGFLAYRTYTGEPPIPGRVVDPDGRLLFTRANIMAGQATFLRNALMEYGSIFGHGAYLGPDYTADYLHRAALMSIDFYNRLGLLLAAFGRWNFLGWHGRERDKVAFRRPGEHHPDSWLESEIARFHRGISLALLFLAGLLLVVEMIQHQRPIELLILSGFLVPIALLVSQLSAAFLAPRRAVVAKDKETFRSSHGRRL